MPSGKQNLLLLMQFTSPLSALLTVNDKALSLNLYRGLGQDLKDGMAIIGRPPTYEAPVK